MAGDSKQPTVLFIDDDADLVAALSRILSRAGYRVRHAADGDEGVRMADEDRPDVIVLDFIMPAKSGFDVCSELKARPELAKVPILVLTAFGQDIGEIHGMARADAPPNIQDYLEKPIEGNVLLERIASAIAASPAPRKRGQEPFSPRASEKGS